MIRVLLVDDHALLRAGVSQFLATVPDIEMVGEAVDGGEAVEKVRRLMPDVVTKAPISRNIGITPKV